MIKLREMLYRLGLTQLDIAIMSGVILIVVSLVAPLMLSKIRENRFQEVYESLLNTKLAFESYYSQYDPGKTVPPQDGDYIQELVRLKLLSGVPRVPGVSTPPKMIWNQASGKVVFEASAGEDDASSLLSIARLLDHAADDSKSSSGEVQYTFGKSPKLSVVLGLTPPTGVSKLLASVGINAASSGPDASSATKPVSTASKGISQYKSMPGSESRVASTVPTPKPTLVPFAQTFAETLAMQSSVNAPSGIPLTPQVRVSSTTDGTATASMAPLPVAPKPLPIAPKVTAVN